MSKKKSIQLPPPQLPENQKLHFSFQYYDGSRYCLSEWAQADIRNSLQRLKEVCRMSFNDMRKGAKVFHFHEVDWSQTTEKKGFPDAAVKNLQAFQFMLLGINNQQARVYGAYSSGTFYIVWFDLNHSITPSILKHT